MAEIVDIEYWSDVYDYTEEDDDEYKDALKCDNVFERLEALWGWKGFDQSKPDGPPDSLQKIDFEEYVGHRDQSQAVENLRSKLQEKGAISKSNGTLVMPSFILHLTDSDLDSYSRDFPIYDIRVWDSYVYLNREQDGTESLFAVASESPEGYQEYCEWFDKNCPDGVDARKFEKALFAFGKTIRKVPTPKKRPRICDIDNHIEKLQQAASEGN